MISGARAVKGASPVLNQSANLTRRFRFPNGSKRSIATAPDGSVIFSGIQPTGVPHLGNYLGALRQWVKLQDDAGPNTRLIYSLVDLHAITIQQDRAKLRQWKQESFAMLLAIGLDPKRSIIFHQSQVPAHSELMWILSCQASTGYLGRMTQWKDKTNGENENSAKLKLGLFSYPVLQAADILVHGATHVPVGHDQAQHLEFSRQLANGFNESTGAKVLIAPETLISPAKRIMSLKDPKSKMSKSDSNVNSRILLTDSGETIRKKISQAITDSIEGISYDPANRPGVSNLIDLLYHTDPDAGHLDQEALAKDLEGLSFRALKEKVADSVDGVIRPIREKYNSMVGDENMLESVAQEGRKRAIESASVNLERCKHAVGL